MRERRLLPRHSVSVTQLNNDLVAVPLCGLFFSVEVVDEREDETADGADELHPIMNLHTRHLLPSRKKADTSNCLP